MSLTKTRPTDRPDLPPVDLTGLSRGDMRAIVERELKRRMLISLGNKGRTRTPEQRQRIGDGKRRAQAIRKAQEEAATEAT